MEKEKYSLVGVNGNALAIIGYTAKAMKMEGFLQEEIAQMRNEAMQSDYYNLVDVCDRYIDKVNKKVEEMEPIAPIKKGRSR